MVTKSQKNTTNIRFWILITLYLLCSSVLASDRKFNYQHGTSYIEPLKYAPDFEHFDYVNPEAPKGGTLRFPELGTFDSFNNMVDKGRKAWGMDLLGVNAVSYTHLTLPTKRKV